MRYAFSEELINIAQRDKNVILLTADLGYTVFEKFIEKFPKQFLNVGVAESNMVGVATGLALSGKTVFIYSIAPFVTLRPYEQIRNDICLHKAPVILVGSGSGLSYSHDGPTHHGTEDIAVMRTLPNMTVLCPADPIEAQWATRQAVSLKSPVYLRLGKKGEPTIHSSDKKLKIGKGVVIKGGKDFMVITTGNIVHNVLETVYKLEVVGLKGGVISMHTLKPLDKKLVTQLALNYKYIITVEEHTMLGGLGSAVAEIISQIPHPSAQLLIIGLKDIFNNTVGSQFYLRKLHGLSPQKLHQSIKKFIKK